MLRLILKLVLYFIILTIISRPIQSLAFSKNGMERFDDINMPVNYDEYPMVVPRKRAGNINTLYRLMVALHNVLEDDDDDRNIGNSKKYNHMLKNTNYDENDLKKFKTINKSDEYDEDIESNEQHTIQFDESMDLQRRGQMAQNTKGRVYWRCYFNAVSCF